MDAAWSMLFVLCACETRSRVERGLILSTRMSDLVRSLLVQILIAFTAPRAVPRDLVVSGSTLISGSSLLESWLLTVWTCSGRKGLMVVSVAWMREELDLPRRALGSVKLGLERAMGLCWEWCRFACASSSRASTYSTQP